MAESVEQKPVPSYGPTKHLVGLLAEFETPEQLLEASKACRDKGLKDWDAHTPFPLHGLAEAMGLKPSKLPWAVFGAGIFGGIVGMSMQFFTNAVWYPFIVSGKPFYSLPASIPPAFETTILFAGITAVVALLVFCGLPRPNHPVFTSHRFKRASDDRFFVSVLATDPSFESTETAAFLESLNPVKVERLEEE